MPKRRQRRNPSVTTYHSSHCQKQHKTAKKERSHFWSPDTLARKVSVQFPMNPSHPCSFYPSSMENLGQTETIKQLGIAHPWHSIRGTSNYRPFLLQHSLHDMCLSQRGLKDLANRYVNGANLQLVFCLAIAVRTPLAK